MKTTTETQDAPAVRCEDLLGWLRVKLAAAEKELRAREQSVATFRSGTYKDWAIAADMHPTTRGKPMSKEARLEAARIQARCASQCRREVEMFKAALAALAHPNDEVRDSRASNQKT